jgi:hypothetical protein
VVKVRRPLEVCQEVGLHLKHATPDLWPLCRARWFVGLDGHPPPGQAVAKPSDGTKDLASPASRWTTVKALLQNFGSGSFSICSGARMSPTKSRVAADSPEPWLLTGAAFDGTPETQPINIKLVATKTGHRRRRAPRMTPPVRRHRLDRGGDGRRGGDGAAPRDPPKTISAKSAVRVTTLRAPIRLFIR